MMRKIYFILMVSLFFSEEAFAQVNLVINPSFELDTCPGTWTGWGEIFGSMQGWDTIRNGGGGTPDIFDECYIAPNKQYDIPFNYWGYQYSKSGNSYAALVAILTSTSGGNVREYIQGKLTQQLTSNNHYCVKLFVNLSNRSRRSSISFGVYFDDGQITADVNNFGLPNVIPQIENMGQQLDDTLNWMVIEGGFIANGTEEYITIGNFLSDDSSNVIESYPLSSFIGAYYYIDDVSVIDVSTPAYAGIDTTLAIGDSVFIGRQPEIGLNEACVWYVNGNPIDTIAGFWVNPNTTTTYVLEQTICGNVAYDTVTVTVQPTGLENFINQQEQFVVYPNPSNGELWIKLGKGLNDQSLIVIYDIAGRIVYQKNLLITNATKINADLKQGTYFISIKPNNYTIKPFNDKITIIE